jgi:hypothetical protein
METSRLIHPGARQELPHLPIEVVEREAGAPGFRHEYELHPARRNVRLEVPVNLFQKPPRPVPHYGITASPPRHEAGTPAQPGRPAHKNDERPAVNGGGIVINRPVFGAALEPFTRAKPPLPPLTVLDHRPKMGTGDQTESRFLPFARRRARTLRPPSEDILERKP